MSSVCMLNDGQMVFKLVYVNSMFSKAIVLKFETKITKLQGFSMEVLNERETANAG